MNRKLSVKKIKIQLNPETVKATKRKKHSKSDPQCNLEAVTKKMDTRLTYFLLVSWRLMVIQDQQFPDFNNNQLSNFHKPTPVMAHLRTSFIQAYNSSNPLFSCITGIVSNAGSLFNNDDKEDRQNLKSKEKTQPVRAHRSFTFLRQRDLFFSEEQRSVHSLINLNINNLSQLTDQDSTDFKGHDNFIHVLDLEKEQETPKLLEEMETVQSLHLENNIVLVNNQSPNSTRISTEPTEEDGDHSDVEPFEM